MSYPVLISSSQIFDMQRIDVLENSVLIGASNTLTEIHSFLRYVIETKEGINAFQGHYQYLKKMFD